MVVTGLLGTDDTVEISLHKLLDEIDLGEVMQQPRAENVEDADDVLVVTVAEELDFMEGTEAEHGVVEGCGATLRWVGRWMAEQTTHLRRWRRVADDEWVSAAFLTRL